VLERDNLELFMLLESQLLKLFKPVFFLSECGLELGEMLMKFSQLLSEGNYFFVS
jgi:hypothetical protein